MKQYRAEVDGLRAIAVIAVIVYHADLTVLGLHLLPGGFLGVDIFFVISGYLIGRVVLDQSEPFDLATFYERRARRLLPALYVVLAATLLAGWFLLLADQMRSLGVGAISVATFWSNIFFWRQGGYTAEANELQPLLHTWSLSLEEQFYLLFPPMVLLLRRFSHRAILPVFAAAFVASLALAIVATPRAPSASFYLLPTRAWELLAGVVLAKLELDGRRIAFLSGLWPVLGLGAILASISLANDQQLHPGLVTVPVVVGTLAVLAGRGGLGHWLLSKRLMVGIGLISYSAYLWHQPIMAFVRIGSINAPSTPVMVASIAVSLFVGAISWRLVERPFRNRRAIRPKAIWLASASGVVVFVTVSTIVIAADGFPFRFPPIIAASDPAPEWWALMQDGEPCHRNDRLDGCRFQLNEHGPAWVVVGDSHAGVLANALLQEVTDHASSFDTMIWGGCPVIFDVEYVSPGSGEQIACGAANRQRRAILESLDPSFIVYAARMGAWLDGTRFDNGEGGVEPGTMDLLEPIDGYEGAREDALSAEVTKTIQQIVDMGHTVIVVYPIPEVGWHVPRQLRKIVPRQPAAARDWLANHGLTTSLDRYHERNVRAFEAYDAVSDSQRLHRIFPHLLFCGGVDRRCRTHDEESYFYSDDDHLSNVGAAMVVERIVESVR